MGQEDDPNREMLLKMVKQSNEAMNKILDGITNLLPEDSQVTGVVKGLVQYAKSAGQQLETMLDPEKMQEQMIQEVSQYITDFTDFTEQLLSGDFENIDWAEVGQKLHVSEIATAINPIAGVIATLAVDVAPKVVKIVEASNSGDKAELIQNAIGAFTNCMGVIGQLKSAVGNKLAEFSKDVDAKVFDEASQTYQNLEQIQDAGYKYETYVKAEMFDQANQEALKLNDLSTDMMQGKATGYATNIDSIDVDAITNDNYQPSTTVLQGGISKTDYPDVNTEVPNVQNPQTTDWGDSAIMASQISNAINSIMNNSQNAKNLNISGSPQFNASIETIKQAQTVQKKNLDNLLQKVTTAKNQDEYSKLLKEYAKQKEQYQKTQDLTAQIEHSVQKGNSQEVAQNYTQQGSGAQPANQKLTREHYNNKLDALINNALGIQPASAEEISYKPSQKMMEGSISKDAYITNTNNFGNRDLNQINNYLNRDYKDSRDLMNIALDGPKNAPTSKEYTFISSEFNNNLNRDLKLTGNNRIPDNWDGFVFSKDSTLSYNLSKSPELKAQILAKYNTKNNSFPSKISISLNKDKNLKWSIHGATIINAKIDAQGNITGLLHDNYDYKLQDYKDDLLTNLANNSAYFLQQSKRLKNYYLFVPIKFKIDIKNKI